MSQSLPHEERSSKAEAITAPTPREDESSREGRMGAIRIFVVLAWAIFAVRQIFVKPVEVLIRKD